MAAPLRPPLRPPPAAIRQRIWPSTYLLAALLIAAVLLPLPQNDLIAGMPSICLFHNVTGLPCPGCGLTRSWVAMAHGQWGAAFAWHPLGPLLFLSALGYTLWSLWMALQRPPFLLSAKWRRLLLIGASALMLVFWAARLAGVFPLQGG